MHHKDKSYFWLSICALMIMVKTGYSLSCINMTNERTRLLEGLDCFCDAGMLEMPDHLPPIRILILDGGGCPHFNAVRWITTQLQSPGILQSLSLRNCRMHIGEEDMAPLANLTELSVYYGSVELLYPRAFLSLKRLKSLTLTSLGLTHFPDAVTGHFNISTNQTDGLDVRLPCLQHLDLSSNRISDIPDDTFIHLPNLEYLDLAKNRLHRLDAEPFRYLRKLQILNVSLNQISELPNQGFRGVLLNLHTLVMNNAAIFALGSGSFRGLARLRFLDISLGVINTLHPLSLQGLDSLQEINILFNPLRSVPQELLRPVNSTLRKINLSECKLSTIPRGFFEGLPLLEEVNLSKNQIASIESISFKDSPKLKTLDIAENSITDIPLNFFDLTTSIETVRLEGNSISAVHALTFWNLNDLQHIYMSKNNLTALETQAFYNLQSLKTLDLSGNFLQRVPNDALYNIPALQQLNLADNYLINFPHLPFINRDALSPTLYPTKAVTVDMQLNWLWCDCYMFSLISDQEYIDLFWPGANLLANLRFKNYQELMCSMPPILRGEALYDPRQMSLLNPSLASFSGFYCPESCQCYTRCNDSMNITICNANLTRVPQNLSKDINVLSLADNGLSAVSSGTFVHMKALLEIDLSGNYITTIGEMFRGMSSLTTIHLGHNHIGAVTRGDFKGLTNLTFLDLQHNVISFIEPGSFSDLEKLQFLYLDHNLMPGLLSEVLNSIPSLRELRLDNNPLICDCDLMWLKEWLQTKDMENVESINCTTQSNETAAVVYLDDYEFMCNSTDVNVQAWDPLAETVAVCLGVLVFLMSTAAAVYRFRRVIQVVVYNHTGLRFSNKMDKDKDRTYLYDAFISFSTDDLDFVTQELVPKLESHEPPFKLCIHQRDFVVGECISTNIVNAVETSRRTLIVLSNSFVASEWCSFEFQAAQQQLLKDRQNRLIVILLEEVDKNLLDKDLKLYLSTNTYLERTDSLFWEKLYYAMPDKMRVGLDQGQVELNSLDKEDSVQTAQDEVELQVHVQEDLRQLIT
ncbi:toll-like receptor Tollo [Patiria miniata]|uniref:TIR domain-containing protein n=1 Tax=Patiria miniata TaxID=46514 RepID=A0A914B4S3_PATMI|nr:toll-like receptor Tollo [Patiria miniata]